MEAQSIFTITPEMFRHLSFYLSEADLVAFSESCVYIFNSLNDNSVWKRFLTEKERKLPLQNQQLDPPFEPDPDLCENYQLTLMKNHLVGNWKNQKCVEYCTKTDYHYASGVFNIPRGKGQLIYKEDYLFLGRFRNDVQSDAIEVWDIRKEPTLHAVIPIDYVDYDSFFVFDQTLVVVVCSRVDVYEINVESKEFPLLYSYLIAEEEVVLNKPALHEGRHDMRCVGWRHYQVDSYLVSNKCGDELYPVLHVWDIPNACKVGAFVSPIIGFSISVCSSEGSDWYVCQNLQSGQKLYHFKFNIRSRKFSDNVFEYDGPHPTHLMFYKNHLIMFKNAENADSEGWYDSVCEVYDLNNSQKLQERRFDNAHKNHRLNSTTVFDGKFVLLCKGEFLVVDALSLETVDSMQTCLLGSRFITHQINVSGHIFVLTNEKDYSVCTWDIENKQKLSTLLKDGYNCHLSVSESKSRIVMLTYRKMHVVHFW